MTKKRRLVLVLGLGIAVCLLFIASFVRVAYWSSGPFAVTRMGEIPHASPALRDMGTFGSLAYVHLSRWHQDVFCVRGFTTQEALLKLIEQNPSWSVWNKGEYAQPPDHVARLMRAFGPTAGIRWTNKHWLIEGIGEDRRCVFITFDPESGLFYAKWGVERTARRTGNGTAR